MASFAQGLLGLAFLGKGYHLSGLPLVQTWHDRVQGVHFTVLLLTRLLPGVLYIALPKSYGTIRPVLIMAIRLAHACSAALYTWLTHTCMGMPCFVLRGHFLDILALNAVLLPLMFPLRFLWALVPQLVHFTTGAVAMSSRQGLCASVSTTYAITQQLTSQQVDTTTHTCLRNQHDGERCALFLAHQRDFFAWLRTALAYGAAGHYQVDDRRPLSVTTSCCIVSVAMLMVVQLCVSAVLYLMELKERVAFYEQHARHPVQVHPTWSVLQAWVLVHFALAVGAVAMVLGLVL